MPEPFRPDPNKLAAWGVSRPTVPDTQTQSSNGGGPSRDTTHLDPNAASPVPDQATVVLPQAQVHDAGADLLPPPTTGIDPATATFLGAVAPGQYDAYPQGYGSPGKKILATPGTVQASPTIDLSQQPSSPHPPQHLTPSRVPPPSSPSALPSSNTAPAVSRQPEVLQPGEVRADVDVLVQRVNDATRLNADRVDAQNQLLTIFQTRLPEFFGLSPQALQQLDPQTYDEFMAQCEWFTRQFVTRKISYKSRLSDPFAWKFQDEFRNLRQAARFAREELGLDPANQPLAEFPEVDFQGFLKKEVVGSEHRLMRDTQGGYRYLNSVLYPPSVLERFGSTVGDASTRVSASVKDFAGTAAFIGGEFARGVAAKIPKLGRTAPEAIDIIMPLEDILRSTTLTQAERDNLRDEFLAVEVRADGDLQVNNTDAILVTIQDAFKQVQVVTGPERDRAEKMIAMGLEYMQAINRDVIPQILGFTRFEAMPQPVQEAVQGMEQRLVLHVGTGDIAELEDAYQDLQKVIAAQPNGQGKLQGQHRINGFLSHAPHRIKLREFLDRYTNQVIDRPHFLSETGQEGLYAHHFFPQLEANAYLSNIAATSSSNEATQSLVVGSLERADRERIVINRMDDSKSRDTIYRHNLLHVPDFIADQLEVSLIEGQNSGSHPLEQELVWMEAIITGRETYQADQTDRLQIDRAFHTREHAITIMDLKKELKKKDLGSQTSVYLSDLSQHFVVLRHKTEPHKMGVIVPEKFCHPDSLKTLSKRFPDIIFIQGNSKSSNEIGHFAAHNFEQHRVAIDAPKVGMSEEGTDTVITDSTTGVVGIFGNTRPERGFGLLPTFVAGGIAAPTYAEALLTKPSRNEAVVQEQLRNARRRTKKHWRKYEGHLDKDERRSLEDAQPTATVAHVVGGRGKQAALIMRDGNEHILKMGAQDRAPRRITFDPALEEAFYGGKITREQQLGIQQILDSIVTKGDLTRVMLELAQVHFRGQLPNLSAEAARQIEQELTNALDLVARYTESGEGAYSTAEAFDYCIQKKRTKRGIRKTREGNRVQKRYLSYLPSHLRDLAEYYNKRNTGRGVGKLHAEEMVVPLGTGDQLYIASATTPPSVFASVPAMTTQGNIQQKIDAASAVSSKWNGKIVGLQTS